MEDQVTRDIAQAVKTLGFNLRVTHYVDNNHEVGVTDNVFGWDYNNSFKGWYSLPTYDQVLKFFRDKYNVQVIVMPFLSFDTYGAECYKDKKLLPIEIQSESYEEARRTCIFKVIDILKKRV